MPKTLLKNHVHEQMDLPGKLWIAKRIYSVNPCKMCRTNSSVCYRKEQATYEKNSFQHTIWTPVMSSVPGVSQKSCLSICNHGTAAMMAVTVLFGKTLASSRHLDSVLDISRLKHAVILVNPMVWMVRISEMVPPVHHGNFHLDKSLQNEQAIKIV